jgi:hypothetical protein
MAVERTYPTPSTCSYAIHMTNPNGVSPGGEHYDVDDMYRVDFQRRISRQPIYGYDDKKFGFVAEGKELVTGNIIINFRYPGYLRNFILAVRTAERISQAKVNQILNGRTDPELLNFAFTEGNTEELSQQIEQQDTSEEMLESLANLMLKVSPTPHAMSEHSDRKYNASGADTIPDNMSFLRDNRRVVANRAAARWADSFRTNASTVINALQQRFVRRYAEGESADKFNQTTVGSPLDIDVNNMAFDMSVRYGNNGTSQYFRRIFKDCYLIGEEETVSASAGVGGDLSSSAQPILEVYPFFARTITVEYSE